MAPVYRTGRPQQRGALVVRFTALSYEEKK